MIALFLNVVTLSFTCSLILLPTLLLARFFSRRYAARTLSVFWLVLAARMALPIQITLPKAPVRIDAPLFTLHFPTGNIPAVNTGHSEVLGEVATRSVDLMMLLAVVWLAGVLIFMLYQLIVYLRLRRRLLQHASAVDGYPKDMPRRVRLIRSDQISTPMMLGLFRPILALPSGEIDPETLDIVLRHELCHLRRLDVAYKAVLLLANAVHWFNPLVWCMGWEASRNLELCCDDDVLRDAGRDERRHYGEVLLAAACKGNSPVFATRFGSPKKHLQVRLGNLFTKKRRGFGIMCVLLTAGLLIGTLVSCETQKEKISGTLPPVTPSPVDAEKDLVIDGVIVNDSAKNLAAASEKPMGVDFPQIDYVSEDLLVFHDYWGLAVYDFRQSQIVRLADTPSIGMNLIQGDQYTHVKVADSLDRIYLFNVPQQELKGESWIYRLEDDILQKSPDVQADESGGAASTVEKGEFFFPEGGAPVMADLTYRAADGSEYRVFEAGDRWSWPLEGYYAITSTFGPRIHPLTGKAGDHTGTDIAAPEGTPVKAAHGGTVTECGYDATWGNYIKIDHGEGYATRYCQLASYSGKVGDAIEQGQTIGYVGQTGSSTGPHLHLELWYNDARSDVLTKYPELMFTYQ